VRAFGNPGVAAALAAALLFGIATPLAKLLLGQTSPWLLAGLFYAGSGIGLFVLRRVRRAPKVVLARNERPWLAAAIFTGGVVAPVLLLYGLSNMPASGASMLLNAEGLFTALIAWFVFRENFDHRILVGMLAILAGALLLSWPGDATFGSTVPALAVVGACLAWGLDNNFTRRVSLADATFIAMVKGMAAGTVNVVLAILAGGAIMPPGLIVGASAVLGFFSYGASLVLFVVALRHLGTARTGAYFSTAPFAGAAIAIVLLREPVTWQFAAATLLMGLGVRLHLSERHAHPHFHEPMEHTHEHEHDVHHQHAHDGPVAPGERHTHRHQHEPMAHEHPHYPDAHHRHPH
jgi:drug/metabolite transporter (DMT)-like permease